MGHHERADGTEPNGRRRHCSLVFHQVLRLLLGHSSSVLQPQEFRAPSQARDGPRCVSRDVLADWLDCI